MSTYILVDYANLFHRSKHAVQGDVDMKAGMAMHIAFNSLKKMWNMFNADHVVVCLEGGSWRKDISSDYKANRAIRDLERTKKEIADDEFFFDVMDQFATFLDKQTNVTVIKESKIEADDIIARWIALHPNDNHVIFSGDSDFYQLLAENVSIYDGVKDQTITINSITGGDGKPVTKTRTVRKKNKFGKVVTKKETIMLTAPNPEYELFKKIVRGDTSDNIFPAYPGVRENGSSKKPGIIEAFADRHNKGYDWNAFMLTEWEKITFEDGESETITVKVADEFKKNNLLINLSAQPEEIKAKIDNAIIRATQKENKKNVGIRLLQFCGKMDLVRIAQSPEQYAKILQAKYGG